MITGICVCVLSQFDCVDSHLRGGSGANGNFTKSLSGLLAAAGSQSVSRANLTDSKEPTQCITSDSAQITFIHAGSVCVLRNKLISTKRREGYAALVMNIPQTVHLVPAMCAYLFKCPNYSSNTEWWYLLCDFAEAFAIGVPTIPLDHSKLIAVFSDLVWPMRDGSASNTHTPSSTLSNGLDAQRCNGHLCDDTWSELCNVAVNAPYWCHSCQTHGTLYINLWYFQYEN